MNKLTELKKVNIQKQSLKGLHGKERLRVIRSRKSKDWFASDLRSWYNFFMSRHKMDWTSFKAAFEIARQGQAATICKTQPEILEKASQRLMQICQKYDYTVHSEEIRNCVLEHFKLTTDSKFTGHREWSQEQRA